VKPNGWLGAPVRLLYERIIEGEVPDAEFPAMVEEIRVALRHPGQVSQLGRSFSWTSVRGPSSTRAVEVAVSVRGGRTRITVHEGLGSLLGGLFGGLGGGLGGGGMGMVIPVTLATLGPAALAVTIPAWLASVFGVSRTLYRRGVNNRRRELEALVDRLAELSRELVPRPVALPGPDRPRLR